ncbi:hypothetical protein SDC9_153341 [bioreactor metagenome]|uniref:rRNA biogenesis protein rrp5 n=1 Tax=bioreactor metagenome TaxID=1076179 RepID=A0A645EXE6_9ZZZZ
MNKNKIIKDIKKHLEGITACLETLIDGLDKTADIKEINQKEVTTTSIESNPPKPITLEEVRAVLAAKSQAGKQPEVKSLITKHGGQKLTDLNPSCYEELLKEAEVL